MDSLINIIKKILKINIYVKKENTNNSKKIIKIIKLNFIKMITNKKIRRIDKVNY